MHAASGKNTYAVIIRTQRNYNNDVLVRTQLGRERRPAIGDVSITQIMYVCPTN